MKTSYRINYQIKASTVNMVLPDNKIREDVPIKDALEIAKSLGLDLVEVVPMTSGSLPICRVVDFGKMKYKQSKKHKSQKQVVKEIKFGISIADHDLETKNKKVHQFLKKHYIVRYSLELKGRREQGLVEPAKVKMKECLEEFRGEAQWSPIKVSNGSRMTRITTTISAL